jgi:galactose mutarotase-like enzyme
VITLGGRDGELEVVVSARGARLVAVRHEGRDLLCDPAEDPDGYAGATIGRSANRIAGGRFELDGVERRLPVNDRGNTLHGGPDGFDARTWTVLETGRCHVVLGLVSPDGDQGFPGELDVQARLEVDGPRLATSYDATTSAPTVVSLTSHPYYRLVGPGRAVTDHRLRVAADDYLPVDDTGLPTGTAPVPGTRFDHDRPRPLAADLDHCWVLRGSGLREVATLTGDGLALDLATDQPGLQVYSGGGRIDGVALEPQHLPDSPHHPDWPSTVLRPGEDYRWRSVVTVRTVDDAGSPPTVGGRP